MQIDLDGRTALITGASTGLGLAMAERFAASGANVVIMARNADRLREAADGIDSGTIVRPLACDVTDATARDAAIGRAIEEFGTIDIVVNNAGSSRRGPVEDLSREDFVADMDLKLYAPLAVIQGALPGMKRQGWGRIVNISAIVGKAPDGGSLPTSVSRGAGLTMAKALSKELAPLGITVNALCVGKIKSGQWERRHAAADTQASYEEFLQPVARTIPMGRMGEAAEFAAVACFLASDHASYVTGTAINVDGGLCAVT